jgi:hypothetical protein
MVRTFQGVFALVHGLIAFLLVCVLANRANAAQPRVPAVVVAGQGFSISADGSGQATFYLVGPDHVQKRAVNLGGDIEIQSSDVRTAGLYQVTICDSSCTSISFQVKAAQPAHISFFLHPSRVPVSMPDSIDATAFLFDQYFNLILDPNTISFQITGAGGSASTQQAPSRNGVAWIRMNSTQHEGQVKVTAGLDNVEEARVVQQVAAEACGLRMKSVANGKNAVTLETDPVRDCSGNPLPDGTIVSFIKVDSAGKSTVDTPIKKGIARAQFTVSGAARISVACGVVLGNELALSGKL